MRRKSELKALNRIIDANINRTKEGLRVCEEIARFVLNSRGLTSRLKEMRHRIQNVLKSLPPHISLIQEREAGNDVGRNIRQGELDRKNLRDILFANLQRIKESLRVLEEFSKLISARAAVGFKKIRYDMYIVEKEITKKLSSLK